MKPIRRRCSAEAGLELGAEDTFTAQTDGGVSAITVNRIQLVRVQNGGEELEVATYGSTVSGHSGAAGDFHRGGGCRSLSGFGRADL